MEEIKNKIDENDKILAEFQEMWEEYGDELRKEEKKGKEEIKPEEKTEKTVVAKKRKSKRWQVECDRKDGINLGYKFN